MTDESSENPDDMALSAIEKARQIDELLRNYLAQMAKIDAPTRQRFARGTLPNLYAEAMAAHRAAAEACQIAASSNATNDSVTTHYMDLAHSLEMKARHFQDHIVTDPDG